MEHEEFLAKEYKLHLSTDKAYRAYLNKMEELTVRQVYVQEQLLERVTLMLSQQDTRGRSAKKKSSKIATANSPSPISRKGNI